MGDIAVTVQNLVNLYRDVANAIRSKDGTSAPITPSDFAQRILNIPTGGGESQEWMEYSIHDLLKNSYTINDSLLLNYDTWYLYNYEAKTIIQQELPNKIDITTIDVNTFYLMFEQVLDDEDIAIGTKITIVCSDNAVIWSLKYDNKEFALESGDYTKIVFTSDEVWQSLDTTRDIEFKILTYEYNEETYDDLLISNSDQANIFPTAILVDDIKIDYPELTKDADTNYVLDNILGIDDPENYLRTFTPLENYTYDSTTGELSWLYKEKASEYDLYLIVNDVQEEYSFDVIYNSDYEAEDTITCNLFDYHSEFNLSDYTIEDSLKINTRILGERFFDKDNYIDIDGPISNAFITSYLDANEENVLFNVPQDASVSRYRLYNTLGTHYAEYLYDEDSLPVEKMGESNKILAIAKEDNKLCNIDESYMADFSTLSYTVTDEGCDEGFTLREDGWYSCNSFNGVDASNQPGAFAYAKITFNSPKATTVKLCMQMFEYNYYWTVGYISQLNKELVKDSDTTTNYLKDIRWSSYYNSTYYTNIPGYNYIWYYDIPAGESFITIKFCLRTGTTDTIPISATLQNRLKFKIEEEKYNWQIASTSTVTSSDLYLTPNYEGNSAFIYSHYIYIIRKNVYNTYMLKYDIETDEFEKIMMNNTNYYLRACGVLSEEKETFFIFCSDSCIRFYDINTFEEVKKVNTSQDLAYNYSSLCVLDDVIYLVGYNTGSGKIYEFNCQDLSNIRTIYVENVKISNSDYPSAIYTNYMALSAVKDKIYLYTCYSGNTYEWAYRNSPIVFDPKTNECVYDDCATGTPFYGAMYYTGGNYTFNDRYLITFCRTSIDFYSIFIYDTVLKETYKCKQANPLNAQAPCIMYYNGIFYVINCNYGNSAIYKIKIVNGVELIEEGE